MARGLVGPGPGVVDLALPPGGQGTPGKESSPVQFAIWGRAAQGWMLCDQAALGGAGINPEVDPPSRLEPLPPGRLGPFRR